jgi:hypothetical protein
MAIDHFQSPQTIAKHRNVFIIPLSFRRSNALSQHVQLSSGTPAFGGQNLIQAI